MYLSMYHINQSMHPSIHLCYLYIHLSVFLSVCPYFYLCTYDIYLPIHRSIYLLIYLSIYIDIIFLYLHFLICSYKDQSINIFTYLSSQLPTCPPYLSHLFINHLLYFSQCTPSFRLFSLRSFRLPCCPSI